MIQRLERNPCVWHSFTDMYGTRQGANKALRRLREAGIAEIIGRVNFNGEGGDLFAYAAQGNAKRWKLNQLKHDLIITNSIVNLGLEYLRAEDVDRDLLADFELFNGGKKVLNGEVDSGASTYDRIVKERFWKHAGHQDPTVWICCGLWNTSDWTRLEGLRARAGGMTHMWFTTLYEVMKNGLKAIAKNCNGEQRTVSGLLTDVELPSTEK